MKKILVFILCFLLLGCEKKAEVNYIQDGFLSEEIGSVVFDKDVVKAVHLYKPALYAPNKMIIGFDTDSVVNNHYYHIDAENKTVELGEYIPVLFSIEERHDEYGLLVIKGNDFNVYRKEIEIYDKEMKFQTGTVYQYYYEKDNNFKFIYEWEFNKSTYSFNEDFAIDGLEFYDDEEQKGYLIYPTSDSMIVGCIEQGEFKIKNEYPYEKENYVLDSIKTDSGEERCIYKGKDSILLVHENEQYEFQYKDKVSVTKRYILVSCFDESMNLISCYGIDRKTQEKQVYEETFFVNYLHMLDDKHYAYVNPSNDSSKNIYRINEDLTISIIELPFTKEFEYKKINENQFIAYVNENTDSEYIYKFYLVTLKV